MEFTFKDFFGENVVAKKLPDYDEYIRLMEQMRLNYGRTYRTGYVWDPVHGKVRRIEPSDEPMPADLKAYVIAREYDPDKRSFGKIIPELVKHKDELHPFMRRYLLERLRASENEHRRLAERFGATAAQFETKEQPQSVSRDVADETRKFKYPDEEISPS